MDRRIQVVDQLRTDRGLGENQFNGCNGVAGVAGQYCDERSIFFRWVKVFSFNSQRGALRESGHRICGALQEFANLRIRLAALIGRKSLCGISQHELVALFDGVATLPDSGLHFWLSMPQFEWCPKKNPSE